ncbi:Putative defense protein Hdd11-like [Frankliniella fusca]|uniref:Defense protein Hdd11-like n=1 Tax=Frankliniella fusca TaxID=407009 RepID=A0AAE1LBU5_9NEOP|nr:Putative defense protein Hdd11-like [Frankliniella fusca]
MSMSPRMLALQVAVLVSAACLVQVHGYGSGAPPDACGDMIPQHHTDPQNSPSPYQIRSAKTKTPGQVIVTITGPEPFKGFMAQCRVGNTPVGKFINPPSNVKLVDCGGGKGVRVSPKTIALHQSQTAATHNDKSEKKEIILTWKAPPNLKEQVTCAATVAKNGGVFWVNQKSNTLTL